MLHEVLQEILQPKLEKEISKLKRQHISVMKAKSKNYENLVHKQRKIFQEELSALDNEHKEILMQLKFDEGFGGEWNQDRLRKEYLCQKKHLQSKKQLVLIQQDKLHSLQKNKLKETQQYELETLQSIQEVEIQILIKEPEEFLKQVKPRDTKKKKKKKKKSTLR
eukprot:TRINITY_DN15945_c0_g1_i2.p1 TRINITY_DN15945_c0_g1~~TRINITY_DN15945_c0_g1_i2.p1  ORF type:complete len:180 (+),score=53.94 TRINITY_DN15945_c0_g1_i2:47-541(+)